MTNPNVPANQAEAAKSSAPDAKVMPSQPAQLNQSAPAATPTAAPAAAAPTAAVQTGTLKAAAPVDGNLRTAQADQARQDLKADRAEEQKTADALDSKNESAAKNNDYFQKVANDDAVFQDPFREQARQERLKEAEANKGDPTRDPVAKQQAMDMNTPAPGAVEEAEKMRK